MEDRSVLGYVLAIAVLLAAGCGAAPVGEDSVLTSAGGVVWETLVMSRTTMLCPTKLGADTSDLLTYPSYSTQTPTSPGYTAIQPSLLAGGSVSTGAIPSADYSHYGSTLLSSQQAPSYAQPPWWPTSIYSSPVASTAIFSSIAYPSVPSYLSSASISLASSYSSGVSTKESSESSTAYSTSCVPSNSSYIASLQTSDTSTTKPQTASEPSDSPTNSLPRPSLFPPPSSTLSATSAFPLPSSSQYTISISPSFPYSNSPPPESTTLTPTQDTGLSTLTMGNTISTLKTTLSSIPSALSSIVPSSVQSSLSSILPSSIAPSLASSSSTFAADDIFTPVTTDPPPAVFDRRSDHPVKRYGIQDKEIPMQTNKFYSNFFLPNTQGFQEAPVYPQPYMLKWFHGNGGTKSWGMGLYHTDFDQVMTSHPDVVPWINLSNQHDLEALSITAAELTDGTSLTTDTLAPFSVNANLLPPGETSPLITIPVVQGMGFITALYKSPCTPQIPSGTGYQTISDAIMMGTTAKYRVTLKDGYNWIIYVTPTAPSYNAAAFSLQGNTLAGPAGFTGMIQVAKNPKDTNEEPLYDKSQGTYATGASLSASVNGTTGTYSLTFSKVGPATLLVFALPHLTSAFDNATKAAITTLQLRSTTKGMATAVSADSITMVEPEMPTNVSFIPQTVPPQASPYVFSPATANAVNSAAASDVSTPILDNNTAASMYWSGKAFVRYANMLLSLKTVAQSPSPLYQQGLSILQNHMKIWIANQQQYPLVYDTVWGGLVTSEGYGHAFNEGVDFGATEYNDHQFHYGYHIYANALMAYLDPSWLSQPGVRSWVDFLIKDVAESDRSSADFPFSRYFDWYHGHSWAAGVLIGYDGKNEESSSEDTLCSFGIKLWGKVIGDQHMEARGNLMLAVQRRAINSYFLYRSDNTVEPQQWIGNKVSGIIFENKIDHSSYFGTDAAEISGIQQLPITAITPYIRDRTFVAEEWNTYFSNGRDLQATEGWRAQLVANYAQVDPGWAYSVMSNDAYWDASWVGSDQTRAWYLMYCAAMGGA